jgi:hypothetical protein
MKKLVNTPLSNTIWWATVNDKNNTMNTSTRVDVTDNAIDVVVQHIIGMKEYKERDGYSGYSFTKKNGGTMTLCVIDEDKYKIVKK